MEDIHNWNWWQHKGHPRGQHLLSPCGDLAIVCVPKCSSSYWRHWLEQRDWSMHHNNEIEKHVHVLCCLRDPVDRWVAGISEYLDRYWNDDSDIKCQATLKLVQDRVVLDDHTEVQQYFYSVFPHNSISFFRYDDTLSVWNAIEKWTGTPKPPYKYLHNPINFTDDPVNNNRKAWKNWILDNCDLNSIKSYYKNYDQETYRLLSKIDDRQSNQITI